MAPEIVPVPRSVAALNTDTALADVILPCKLSVPACTTVLPVWASVLNEVNRTCPDPARVKLPVPLVDWFQAVDPPAIVTMLLLAIVVASDPLELLTVMFPLKLGSVEPSVTEPSSTTFELMDLPVVVVDRSVPLRSVSGPDPNGFVPDTPLAAHCTMPPSSEKPPA